MREIKFRTFKNNMMSKPFKFGEAVCFTDGLISVGRGFELMQFTGLKDVNGVDIYEGDIVHWGHIVGYEEYQPRKAVVEFSPDLTFSTFNLEPNHKFRFGCFAYRNTEKALEVIGNIYQNPELLK